MITSFSNISSIDLTMLEGKYIDRMLKLVITDVHTISQIIHSNDSEKHDNITMSVEAAPAVF